MSMDLFEKVLTRTRKPGPVEQRLPKALGTLRFATWLGWAGASLALASGLFPVELGLLESSDMRVAALLRSLPLAAVFAGVALYMRLSILERFIKASEMFPKAEKQTMRMRWTPKDAVLRKLVELYLPDDEDSGGNEATEGAGPVARAVVEKNLRRFDLSTWEAPVTVYLNPQDPDRRVLIDDGRFLYAGNLLAKGEEPQTMLRRNAILLAFALLVAFLAALEAWYSSGSGATL